MFRYIIILLSILTIGANTLQAQNNHTIIVSSNSNLQYAKDCLEELSKLTDKPLHILQSKSGYYIVTLGQYNSKEQTWLAISKLPEDIKKLKPFRAELDYALNSIDERILLTQNVTTQHELQAQKDAKLAKMDQEVISDILKEKKHLKQQEAKELDEQKRALANNTNDDQFIDSLYVGYGQNWKNNDVYRVGLHKKFENRYFESPTGYLSGFYDLSLNHIEYSKNIYALALTPIFAYYINTESTYTPYVYAGIGISALSDTRTYEKEFSSTFQFEDQVGVGIQNKDYSVQLGYIHYSNANIKKPNDGIDIGMLSVIYNF